MKKKSFSLNKSLKGQSITRRCWANAAYDEGSSFDGSCQVMNIYCLPGDVFVKFQQAPGNKSTDWRVQHMKRKRSSPHIEKTFQWFFCLNPEVHSELTPASKNHARNNAKLQNPRDGTQPCGKSSKPCQGSCLATLVCSQWRLRHTPLWACLDGHFPLHLFQRQH